jgi:hypothetical protein
VPDLHGDDAKSANPARQTDLFIWAFVKVCAFCAGARQLQRTSAFASRLVMITLKTWCCVAAPEIILDSASITLQTRRKHVGLVGLATSCGVRIVAVCRAQRQACMKASRRFYNPRTVARRLRRTCLRSSKAQTTSVRTCADRAAQAEVFAAEEAATATMARNIIDCAGSGAHD